MGLGKRFLRWWWTWRPLYWLFRRQPGITVTVARPTSNASGETVQLTTTAPVGATVMELAAILETLSMVGQARMVRENEIVLKVHLGVAHEKWKKVDQKLREGHKLSQEERRWWGSHKDDFTAAGPVDKLTDERIKQAAAGPE